EAAKFWKARGMDSWVEPRIGTAAGFPSPADRTGHLDFCLQRGVERQVHPASAIDRPHDNADPPAGFGNAYELTKHLVGFAFLGHSARQRNIAAAVRQRHRL